MSGTARSAMRLQVAALASIACLAGGCGSSSSSSTAQGGGSIPSIPVLVQRASSHQINSISFTLLTRAGASSVSGKGDVRIRPILTGAFNFNAAGTQIAERIFADALYLELPKLSARDGGRPWVKIDLAAVSRVSGIDVKQLLAQAQNGNPEQTLKLLSAARSLHEVGPATVNGQRTIELQGSFDPRALRSSTLSPRLLAQFEQKMRQIGATSEHVTIYLTSDGAPVRILTGLATTTQGTVSSTEDVRSINQPVSVDRPPAAQTISYAQLQRLGGP